MQQLRVEANSLAVADGVRVFSHGQHDRATEIDLHYPSLASGVVAVGQNVRAGGIVQEQTGVISRIEALSELVNPGVMLCLEGFDGDREFPSHLEPFLSSGSYGVLADAGLHRGKLRSTPGFESAQVAADKTHALKVHKPFSKG